MLKKILFGLVLLIGVLVGRDASAMTRCAAWTPQGACYQYKPDYPRNGRSCDSPATPPGPNEINIYTMPARGGFCVTLPARMGLWNLDGVNGWHGPYSVKDIWVGSTANASQVCYALYGSGCVGLSPGYDYSYSAPPYYGDAPGWQSISVWNW